MCRALQSGLTGLLYFCVSQSVAVSQPPQQVGASRAFQTGGWESPFSDLPHPHAGHCGDSGGGISHHLGLRHPARRCGVQPVPHQAGAQAGLWGAWGQGWQAADRQRLGLEHRLQLRGGPPHLPGRGEYSGLNSLFHLFTHHAGLSVHCMPGFLGAQQGTNRTWSSASGTLWDSGGERQILAYPGRITQDPSLRIPWDLCQRCRFPGLMPSGLTQNLWLWGLEPVMLSLSRWFLIHSQVPELARHRNCRSRTECRRDTEHEPPLLTLMSAMRPVLAS